MEAIRTVLCVCGVGYVSFPTFLLCFFTETGGALLAPDGLEASNPASKLIGSMLIILAPNLEEARKRVESDIYWLGDVVRAIQFLFIYKTRLNPKVFILSGIGSGSLSCHSCNLKPDMIELVITAI